MTDQSAIINTTTVELDHSHVNADWFAALAEAQSRTGNAKKDSVNPHFKSKYADLAEVLDTIKAEFPAFGLSISQWNSFDGSRSHVYTMLGHKSGGYVIGKSSCIPAKTDAQGVGATWTYLRRYSAAAMAGIAQEDDDGQSAAHSRKPAAISTIDAKPTAGVWEAQTEESQAYLLKLAVQVKALLVSDGAASAADHLQAQGLDADERVAIWTRFESSERTALTKAIKAHKEAA